MTYISKLPILLLILITLTTNAQQNLNYKFDFGGGIAAPGYTPVTANRTVHRCRRLWVYKYW
jgi:hypothetical protein